MYRFVSGMLRSAGNCRASEYFRSLAGPLCNAARFVPCPEGSTIDFRTYLVAVESLAILLAIFSAVAACKRANWLRVAVNVTVNDISFLQFTFTACRFFSSSSAVLRPGEKKISRLYSDDVTRLDTK